MKKNICTGSLKRCLAVLLSVILAFSLVPLTAFASGDSPQASAFGDYTLFSGFTVRSGIEGQYETDQHFENLVDGSKDTKWVIKDGGAFVPHDVYFESPFAIIPKGYVITTGDAADENHVVNPAKWSVMAKLNEDDPWETLDTVVNDVELPAEDRADTAVDIVNRTNSAYRYFCVSFKDIVGRIDIWYIMEAAEFSIYGKTANGLTYVPPLAETCTEDGNQGYFTDGEGNYYNLSEEPVSYESIVLSAKTHNYEFFKMVDPTCTEQGYTVNKCQNCGDEQYVNFVTATGHSWRDLETVRPKCTEIGYTEQTCSNCYGRRQINPVPATGHNFDHDVRSVAPTCEQSGYTDYWCSICMSGERQKVLTPALGHDFSLAVETVASTCDKGGYTVYKCSHCDATMNGDFTNPTGHSFENGVCSDCGISPAFAGTWEELQAAFDEGGYVVLTADVTPSEENLLTSNYYLSVPSGKSVVLDLNGYTIDRGLAEKDTSGFRGGSVICMGYAASNYIAELTIRDSSAGQTGKITGGNVANNNGKYAGGITVYEGGTLNLEGGEISGNKNSLTSYTYAAAGGIYAYKATVNIIGGRVTGNESANSDGAGGVTVSQGLLTISGGEISANSTKGVYSSNSDFVMSGGTISGNTGSGLVFTKTGSYECSGTMSGGLITGNTACGMTVSAPFEMSGGIITGNNGAKGAGVFVGSTAFTFSGGEISNNTSTDYGAGVAVWSSGAVMNMTGGIITGNRTTKSYEGAGIYIANKTTVNMSGGEISGNTSYSNGPGVYIAYNGTFNLSGGIITGNISGREEATGNGQSGAGVYVNDGSKFSISGSPVVMRNKSADNVDSNVFLCSAVEPLVLINVTGEISDGALIGVTTRLYPPVDSCLIFTSGLSSPGRNGPYVLSSDKNYNIKWSDNNRNEVALFNETDEHLVSDWAQLQVGFAKGGKFRLVADVTAGENDTALLTDRVVELDLNGHTIDRNLDTAVADGYVIKLINSKASLVINDSSPEKTGKITGGNNSSSAYNSSGGGICLYVGTLTLNGGAITGNINASNSNDYSGGGIFVYDGTLIMNGGEISNNSGRHGGGIFNKRGKVTVYDGKICGNTCEFYGGGISNRGSDTVLTVYGGEISGNTSTNKYGGGICNYEGKSYMSGGLITGNSGGGILSRSEFHLSGGVITGNTGTAGAGLCVERKGFCLSGNPEIYGNTKTSYGAQVVSNVQTQDYVITIEGELDKNTVIPLDNTYSNTVVTSGLPGNGTIDNFACDSSDYGLCLNEDGEVVTGYYRDLTFAAGEGSEETKIIKSFSRAQFTMPGCMFSIPSDRVFAGWQNGETLYQPGDAYTVTYNNVTFTAVYSELTDPAFTSHALVLSGEIGVIFNLKVPDGFDATGAKMTFAIGNSGESEMAFSDASYNAYTNEYSFVCYVGAYRMADKITPVLHYSDGEDELTAEGEPYAVKDYIDFVRANPGYYNEEIISLVNSIADYGHYSQIYLGRIHNYTVGDGEDDRYAEMTSFETDSFETGIISRDVRSREFVKDIEPDKISKITYALDLESSTNLYINIYVKNGVVPDEATLADGTVLPITKKSDRLYRVSVNGIKAAGLNSDFSITVKSEGEQIAAVTVSPMSYVRSVLAAESGSLTEPDVRDTVCALFWYGVAAERAI